MFSIGKFLCFSFKSVFDVDVQVPRIQLIALAANFPRDAFSFVDCGAGCHRVPKGQLQRRSCRGDYQLFDVEGAGGVFGERTG